MADQTRMLETHEWARLDGEIAVVGITSYAVEQLGDVVFVELPEVGAMVVKGEPFGEIESVKAASELIAPMSGEVVAVNQALEDNYDVLADDSQGDGWLIKIKPSAAGEFDSLLESAAYEKTCNQ